MKRKITAARHTIKRLAIEGSSQSSHAKKQGNKPEQERKGPPERLESNLPSAAKIHIKRFTLWMEKV